MIIQEKFNHVCPFQYVMTGDIITFASKDTDFGQVRLSNAISIDTTVASAKVRGHITKTKINQLMMMPP